MSEGRTGKIIRYTMQTILVIMMYVCMASALIKSATPEMNRRTRTLVLDSAMDAEAAIDLYEKAKEQGEEITAFTLWGEGKGAVVHPDTGRAKDVNLLTVCGDSRLVLGGTSWLGYGDKQSCLIGSGLSVQLFGREEAIGEKVKIEERLYQVKGILYDSTDTVLVEADRELKVLMDMASVEIPQGADAKTVIRTLSNQTGLPDRYHNYHVYTLGAKAAAMSLPFILGLSVVIPFGKRAWKSRSRPAVLLSNLIQVLFFLAFFIWIVNPQIRIPGEMIPSRWSDFEFFSQLWEQKTEEIQLLVTGKKTQPELLLAKQFMQTLGLSLTAFFFYFCSLYRMQIKPGTEATFWVVGFLCLTFVLLVKIGGEGLTGFGSRSVWLILPYYIWGKSLNLPAIPIKQ